jgi:hypothetical protein
MAKYDGLLADVKQRLQNAKSVLIALPSDSNLDKTASGAALFLALQSHGKDVQIVSDKLPQVTQANLYGVGSIKNTISSPTGAMPTASNGDYTLVLEGVATSEGTVPALEKLDWYAQEGNLNLVFHTMPGQSFQPKSVYPKGGAAVSGSGNFDLVFVIGSSTPANLGNVYNQNPTLFSTNVVNIDNSTSNTSFGQPNIVDGGVSSVSEMMTEIIPALALPFDRDIATNLLAGIFEVTENLTNPQVGPDTYTAVGNCVRVGGQKPMGGGQPTVNTATVSGFQTPFANSQPSPTPPSSAQPMMDFSAFMQPAGSQPISPAPAPAMSEMPQAFAASNNKPEETFTVPPVAAVLPNEAVQATPAPVAPESPKSYQSSPEERPAGERVVTDSPEPGWLTPKVFKGTSVG